MSEGRRHLVAAVVTMACLGSTVACGGQAQSAGPDCTSQLRFHGTTYTAYRLTHQHSKKVGLATPTCSGKAVDDGHLVTVWSFPGQSPSKVLGRQGVRGRFAIYVADSVSLDERTQILRTMTPPGVSPTLTVGTYADNVAAAAAASTRVVGLTPVPADAQLLHQQPAAWPTDSGMELGPSDPKLTRVRWWSVPETPAAVQRHLLTHTPDGMARDEGIGYSNRTPFVIYDVRTNPQPDAYINPSLLVMWRPNGNRTLIRAESFTSARNLRPGASYIRGSVTSLDIARIVTGTSTHPAGRHVPTAHLTAADDEPAISRVVEAANALPGSVAVGWFGSCPMISDPRPNFTLTFHTTAGTVRMHLELGCWSLVEVHRNGRPVTPSLDPGGLNDVVNRVANAVALSSRSAH